MVLSENQPQLYYLQKCKDTYVVNLTRRLLHKMFVLKREVDELSIHVKRRSLGSVNTETVMLVSITERRNVQLINERN